MQRVSKESHVVKKKKYQPNYTTDGIIFRQKSLLNKRGSECFSVGTCLVRLQDFSNNFNTFKNTVWTVVNHNLIRKYEHVSKIGDYEYFKPTDRVSFFLGNMSPTEIKECDEKLYFLYSRLYTCNPWKIACEAYTRWLPHFVNDYINIDDVMEIDDCEFQIAIRFPSRERIAAVLEASTRDRLAHGLPPIDTYDPLLVEMEGTQSIISESGNTQTSTTSSSTFDSYESFGSSTNLNANSEAADTSNGIYDNPSSSDAFFFGYSDAQQTFIDDVFYGNEEASSDTNGMYDNSVMYNNPDPPNAFYYDPQNLFDPQYMFADNAFCGNSENSADTNEKYDDPSSSDAFFYGYSDPQQTLIDEVFYGNGETSDTSGMYDSSGMYENPGPTEAFYYDPQNLFDPQYMFADNAFCGNSENSADTNEIYDIPVAPDAYNPQQMFMGDHFE